MSGVHTTERAACQEWTPEEVLRLRERVAEYATIEDLVEEFGRSRTAVRTKLYRLGLKVLPRPENKPHQWGGEWHPVKGAPVVAEALKPRPVASVDKPQPEPPKRTMVALMQQMIRLAEDTDILFCLADEAAAVASVLCRAADGRTYRWRWEEWSDD